MGKLQRSDFRGRKTCHGSVTVLWESQAGRARSAGQGWVGRGQPGLSPGRWVHQVKDAGNRIANRGSNTCTSVGVGKGTTAWELPGVPGTEPVARGHMQEELGPPVS